MSRQDCPTEHHPAMGLTGVEGEHEVGLEGRKPQL